MKHLDCLCLTLLVETSCVITMYQEKKVTEEAVEQQGHQESQGNQEQKVKICSGECLLPSCCLIQYL